MRHHIPTPFVPLQIQLLRNESEKAQPIHPSIFIRPWPRLIVHHSQSSSCFPSPSITKPKMAYRAEGKLAAPPTDEASEDKAVVVPDAAAGETDSDAAAVHIVHLIRPEGEEPEAFDIRTLASVIGSEEAAKEAVVYHYTHAASGFSARLTPKQVAHLSEKPEVLVITPDKECQLIR